MHSKKCPGGAQVFCGLILRRSGVRDYNVFVMKNWLTSAWRYLESAVYVEPVDMTGLIRFDGSSSTTTSVPEEDERSGVRRRRAHRRRRFTTCHDNRRR